MLYIYKDTLFGEFGANKLNVDCVNLKKIVWE